MSQVNPENMSIIAAYNEAWEKGDVEALAGIIHDDCVFNPHVGGITMSKSDILGFAGGEGTPRAENERIRKEIEAAEKQAQLDRELENEQKRLDAMRSGALSRYMYALMLKIENNWIQPIGAGKGLSCTVDVRQLPGGEVVSVSVTVCNGDESVRRSIEAAVYKASPLPNPEDPSLFERNLRFIFEPIQ